MNRVEFMVELEKLLAGMQEDERQDVLCYYETYFDDADKSEEDVMKELGPPEQVAKMVQETSDDNEACNGEYTETGYKDERFQENQEVGFEKQPSKFRVKWENFKKKFARKAKEKETTENKMKKSEVNVWKWIAIVLLLLIGWPFIILLAIVWLFIAVLLDAVTIIIALSGILVFVLGIVIFIIGLTKLFTVPLMGMLLCGVGIIVIGLGAVIAVYMIKIAIKTVPIALKKSVEIMRRPFHKRTEE